MIPLIAVALFSGPATPASAAVPDAGQLLREQPPPPPVLKPSPPAAQALPKPEPAGPAVLVRGFRFSGFDGLATTGELQALVRDRIGRVLTLADLRTVADRVTAALRQKGYLLARAYLPPQDVTAGVIEIAAVRAQVEGGVGVKPAAGSRLRVSTLQRYATRAARPGEPLQEQDLEHTLLLINDLPGVLARAFLEQGTAPGTTHVTIETNEGPLVAGNVWADNFGNRYSGAWRGNALLALNDPSGNGDFASLLASGSSDLWQARGVYQVPLAAGGPTAGLSATAMHYRLGEELADLDANGRSLIFNGWLNQRLVLRQSLAVSATLGYEFKQLEDRILGVTLHDKRVQSVSLGLNGSFLHGATGSRTTWSVSATAGDADLSRAPTDLAIDRETARVDGTYARFNFSVSHEQPLGHRLALTASYFGQFATGNLDSSEQFGLGGPYGVRAYPVGEAVGDDSHLLNLELHGGLPAPTGALQVEWFAFADTGWVRLHHDPWPDSVNTLTGRNSYQLSAAGAGVSVSRAGRLAIRLTYAHRLGDNPGRSFAGTNADGRTGAGRLWFSLQAAF